MGVGVGVGDGVGVTPPNTKTSPKNILEILVFPNLIEVILELLKNISLFTVGIQICP